MRLLGPALMLKKKDVGMAFIAPKVPRFTSNFYTHVLSHVRNAVCDPDCCDLTQILHAEYVIYMTSHIMYP